jgi:beta-galactosidase
MMIKNFSFVLIFLVITTSTFPQTSKTEVPMIGAEVFIEPGQTPEQIDTWFKRMKEGGMTITRIRLFESYMHRRDGTWDYTLYDDAYKAGEKYGIKIYGNPFPATSFTDVGGLKYPKDEEHLKSIAECLKNMVTHFKQFKSCYGWVPINEPGIDRVPAEAFSKNKFNEWKKLQPVSAYNSKGYEHFDFAEENFLLDYNVWFLKWLTDEIHKYDPGKPVHVNGKGIFVHVPLYKFPKWRNFLTSLGGSAHPSWHYAYFTRDQYTLAMSANSEILRSGAGDIPWFMTEVQGGINTYSGLVPINPTKEEISQWLWAILASEGKGAMFWCLNPRGSGIEAGEWAMLNFQDEPSDRMKAAASVASVINQNPQLFANAKVDESGINVLYIHEAMWVEKKLQSGDAVLEGRSVGGVLKSALGYFEALSEMGIQVNLKEIEEFDFSKNNYSGSTIILSHQIAVPSRYWQKLENFVSKGGKLIIDGLTAYYDENAVCIMKTGFPLEKLFGGNIKEFKMVENLFDAQLTDRSLTLPAHLWRGTIVPTTARPISIFKNEVIATRNKYGNGEVVWVPALLGLGGRIKKDYSKLSAFLYSEAKQSITMASFRFKTHQPKMLLKTIKSGDTYITVIISKSKAKTKVELTVKNILKPRIIFANMGGSVSRNNVYISPEETMVIQWR